MMRQRIVTGTRRSITVDWQTWEDFMTEREQLQADLDDARAERDRLRALLRMARVKLRRDGSIGGRNRV